jgi:DNA-binding transcriptional ArsR family regulator
VAASVNAVLVALGDRTRRMILETLAAAGPIAVGMLADRLPVSRPAVSQHLRVLKDAELVVESVAGTRRLYRVNESGLGVLRDYFDQFWERRRTGSPSWARLKPKPRAARLHRTPRKPSGPVGPKGEVRSIDEYRILCRR